MARQADVVQELERVASATTEEGEARRRWLAVAGQARRYLRVVRPWSRVRAYRRCQPQVAAHVARLEAAYEAARSAAGPSARTLRPGDLGLRVAVVGKGGAGKTATVSVLSRLLARRGRKVVAADLDVNPGLAFSLGLPSGDQGLPDEALEPHDGAPYGWQLAAHLSPGEAVERFAVPGPDGVRYLGVGKIDEVDKQGPRRTVVAVLQVLSGLGDPDWDVIADLEAGPTTPFENYHAFADQVLVVVGPEWRSALTARRLLPIVGDVPTMVVGNRVDGEVHHPGLDPAVRIPFDPAVAEAERLGLAPLDYCPGSPFVAAVGELALLLMGRSTTEEALA